MGTEMTNHTKRAIAAALDELKREHYAVFIIMMDKDSDRSLPLGSAMEVLCSETNDPIVLKEMLKESLSALSSEALEGPERIN
jgi:hypothetical protein